MGQRYAQSSVSTKDRCERATVACSGLNCLTDCSTVSCRTECGPWLVGCTIIHDMNLHSRLVRRHLVIRNQHKSWIDHLEMVTDNIYSKCLIVTHHGMHHHIRHLVTGRLSNKAWAETHFAKEPLAMTPRGATLRNTMPSADSSTT